jgi:hypothetical protein
MDGIIPTITLELHDRIAQYRTALVALVELVKREGGYRSWPDQMLVTQVERLLDSEK